MKKLFTLFALIAICLGVNAQKKVTVVDAEVDFSKFTDISEVPFASWRGSESAFARLSIQDGCLHFESSEATDPSWDCQFFPIGGVNAEAGVTYTLHYKIKGDHAENVSMLGFGLTPYGQFPITTEWVEGTFDYTATNSDGNMLMQCGGYVGSWDLAYLKITHEQREEKPVEWVNILENGDAEGEYGESICAYSKEYGVNDNNPHAAEIETLDGNKVFVVHTQPVDPPLTWDSDGEQWGQQHSAGDIMPDNAWQNQFWINFPRPLKNDEQIKVSFKYKASETARATSQDHREPGDYLGGGQAGSLDFTTEWKTFEKTYGAAKGAQSLAFNLGEGEQYTKDIIFYFDDLSVAVMKLEEGFFVAGINNEDPEAEYDYENAIKFEDAEEDDEVLPTAIIGTEGNEDTWVNEVMISTARGNDRGFKAATINVINVPSIVADDWLDYEDASNAKLTLPAAGVWKIRIAEEDNQLIFIQIEGDEIVVKEPIEINPNPKEIVLDVQERDWRPAKDDGTPQDGEEGIGVGQPWDNQFVIMADRPLKTGEETVLAFDYTAATEAPVNLQFGGPTPGAYRHYHVVDNDLTFTPDVQHFEQTLVIPASVNNDDPDKTIQSITFNLSVIKGANIYTIKNVIWRLSDSTESLISQDAEEASTFRNFFAKIGAGTNPESLGIDEVVTTNKVSTAKFNLAGQRVTKDYKGIVISNGKKVVIK